MKKIPILALLLALTLWALPAKAQVVLPFSLTPKAAAKVTILPSTVSINDGATRQLTARVQNAQGEPVIRWTVEQGEGVVSVDANGLLTALEPGTAYVRATDLVTGATARRKVTVKKVKVNSVKLNCTTIALEKGETYDQLTATIKPANATVQEVTWSSSKPSAVTVDQNGVLTAVGSGTATITAKAGGKKAVCKVKVVEHYATFTLSAVGDVIMGGDPAVTSALNRSTRDTFAQLLSTYGTSYPFKNVQQVFHADDLTIANLECALTTRTSYKDKTHTLVGDPSYAYILKQAGIDVCNLANNHSKDVGVGGYNDTKAALNSAGIKFSGFSEDGIVTLSKNGITVKVGFAGFQTPTPEASMRARVKALKKRCDIVVVSFHWCDTTEWASKIFASDRKMAQAAIQAGADLVLGSHRHVPAGIERYRRKYIVYDLSNFVVGIKHKSSGGRPLTDSMIFQWTFQVDDTGYLADAGIQVIPCTTTTSTQLYPATDDFGDLGAPVNDWQPAILTGQEGQAVLSRIQAMSTVTIS